MRNHIRTILSFAVFLLGTAGLVFLYMYGPKLDSKEVLVAAVDIGEHEVIRADQLHFIRLPSSAIPERAIQHPDHVIGKVAKGVLPQGAFIYPEWIEEDDFFPKPGEIILPINTSSIFAVNLSLRAKDTVHIAFFMRDTAQFAQPIDLDQTEIPVERADDPLVLRNVRVAAVRSSAGNMIFDAEGGRSNNRFTATETIGSVELIVTEQEALAMKEKLEQGYMLWMSRMK